MAYALIACAIAFGAALISGALFFASGVGIYIFFEKIYGQRLVWERQKAYEAGIRSELEKRAKEIQALDLPTNKYEAEENKTYAEGLAGLYPKDPTLQEAINTSQKLREIVGDA